MDPKQYIASGALELYVLGTMTDPAERAEVERYAREYPEIRQELREIELAVEAFAHANAVPTSPGQLDNLLRHVRKAPDTSGLASEKATAATANWWPWIVAGILLLALLFQYFRSRGQVESLNERIELQENRLTELSEDCNEVRRRNVEGQSLNLLLSDPATRSVLLQGTDNAPDSRAVVLHNPEAETTIFRATNLPTPPTGRQYQLWALDGEGQPNSIAVLATDLTGEALVNVDFFAEAATFAITLEEAGGKPGPDLTQLQVIGQL